MSRLNLFCRKFSEFHAYCKKFKEATRNIIKAMHYLHEDVKHQGSEEHQEFGHRKFIQLYTEISGYYKGYVKQYVSDIFTFFLEPNSFPENLAL